MEMDIDINTLQPCPGDYTFTPSGRLGSMISVGECEGCHLGIFGNFETAISAIQDRMEEEQFFPEMWWVSDHGNAWPIDCDGNEIA